MATEFEKYLKTSKSVGKLAGAAKPSGNNSTSFAKYMAERSKVVGPAPAYSSSAPMAFLKYDYNRSLQAPAPTPIPSRGPTRAAVAELSLPYAQRRAPINLNIKTPKQLLQEAEQLAISRAQGQFRTMRPEERQLELNALAKAGIPKGTFRRRLFETLAKDVNAPVENAGLGDFVRSPGQSLLAGLAGRISAKPSRTGPASAGDLIKLSIEEIAGLTKDTAEAFFIDLIKRGVERLGRSQEQTTNPFSGIVKSFEDEGAALDFLGTGLTGAGTLAKGARAVRTVRAAKLTKNVEGGLLMAAIQEAKTAQKAAKLAEKTAKAEREAAALAKTRAGAIDTRKIRGEQIIAEQAAAKAKQAKPVTADVGITSFRGKPVKTVKEVTPHFETPRAKGFENSLTKKSVEYGVKAQPKRAAGVWQGSIEPSYHINKAKGKRSAVRAYAAAHGKAGNQDAVLLFEAGAGDGRKFVISGVKDADSAIRKLNRSGIDGATVVGDQVIVYGDSSTKLPKFAKNVKVSVTKGTLEFIEKNGYDEIINTHKARGVARPAGRGRHSLSADLQAKKAPAAPATASKKGVKTPAKGKTTKVAQLQDITPTKPRVATPATKQVPITTTGAASGDVVERITQKLRELPKFIKKQEGMFSAERSKRISRAIRAGKTAEGEAGFHAAKAQLKGQMTRQEFNSIRAQFPEADIQELYTRLLPHNSKRLRPFESISASEGLDKIFGRGGMGLPTRSELAALEKEFGSAMVDALVERMPFFQSGKQAFLEGINIPRTAMATADFSGFFRQAFQAGTAHPVKWAKAFPHMVRSAFSPKYFARYSENMAKHPHYDELVKHGLDLTKVGSLARGEEAFLASRLVGKIPIIGRITRGSDRAMVGLLNKMRLDIAGDIVKNSTRGGAKLSDKAIADIAKVVNNGTGRGELPQFLQGASELLNATLFSPKLAASRIQSLNPAYYVKLAPVARKEALRQLFATAATVSSVLALAKNRWPDSVTTDPRNADFGKIKFGNTRVDIAAGFSQYIRLVAQLATGTSVSSNTGEEKSLTTDDYNATSRLDVLGRFVRGKSSPMLAFVTNWMDGKDVVGEPFNLKKDTAELFTPLVLQDIKDLADESPDLLPLAALPFVGVGVQTYSQKRDWNINPSKELTNLKAKIGDDKFKEANDQYNQQFNDWQSRVIKNPSFTELPAEERQRETTKKKKTIIDQIIKSHGIKPGSTYRKPKPYKYQ